MRKPVGAVLIIAGLVFMLVYLLPYLIPNIPGMAIHSIPSDQAIPASAAIVGVGSFLVITGRRGKPKQTIDPPQSDPNQPFSGYGLGNPRAIDDMINQRLNERLGSPKVPSTEIAPISLDGFFEQILEGNVNDVEFSFTLNLPEGTDLKMMGKDWKGGGSIKISKSKKDKAEPAKHVDSIPEEKPEEPFDISILQ